MINLSLFVTRLQVRYFLNTTLNKAKKFETFDLTITSVNIRSLNANWNIFETSETAKADIICVQETWLRGKAELNNLQGYNRVHRNRKTGRGGGVGIYVKKGIVYDIEKTPSREGIIETMVKHGIVEVLIF